VYDPEKIMAGKRYVPADWQVLMAAPMNPGCIPVTNTPAQFEVWISTPSKRTFLPVVPSMQR
jgi:hypothetical protein